jgi:hypothetical protein
VILEAGIASDALGPVLVLRPNEWDLPLFLHVLGAMLLVGALVVALTVFAGAWRTGDASYAVALRRLAFRALLVGALPSYALMRVGAEWIASEENLDEADAGWVDVGYVTADLGLVVLVLATVAAWVAVRRGPSGGALGRVATVLVVLLLAAYLVAVWAMTTKPD